MRKRSAGWSGIRIGTGIGIRIGTGIGIRIGTGIGIRIGIGIRDRSLGPVLQEDPDGRTRVLRPRGRAVAYLRYVDGEPVGRARAPDQ